MALKSAASSHFNFCRQGGCAPVLIGLCVGIALSIVLTPLIEEECRNSADHFAGVRSLQSQQVGDVGGGGGGESDDYEPHLNLEGKSKIQVSENAPPPKKPSSRPRFYSSELGIKEKLFIGVVTDVDRIARSGVAVNTTLAHYADKLVFFMRTSGGSEGQVPATVPTVVGFADGPENLRPFHAINYIGYHHINDYDFFFLMPDDLYVRGPALNALLSGISVSRNVYMGRPLRTMGLVANEPFGVDKEIGAGADGAHGPPCDFAGGILFSQSVLKSVVAEVNWCLENVVTDDASTSINQCVWRAAKVSCQQSVQGSPFLSYLLSKSFDFEADIEDLKDRPSFADAITFHPVNQPDTFYRLHLHFSRVELERTHRDIVELQEGILATNTYLPAEYRSQSWPIGLSPPIKTDDRFSVLAWNYVTETIMYPDGDFSAKRELTALERHDLLEVINAAVSHIASKYRPRHEFVLDALLNGYSRFDPTRGMEYLLDLIVRDVAADDEALVVKRVAAVRALGKVELVPMPYVTENTQLVMLLPVVTSNADSRREAATFLVDFARECLERQDNVLLILLFLYASGDGEVDGVWSLRSLIGDYNNRYQTEGAKVSWIDVKNVDKPPALFGAIDVVSKRFPPETLFIVCQPGMEIHIDYLNRARMNTIAGHQVFFPIPFKQYHPDIIYSEKPYPTTVEISKMHGALDDHEFDYFSFSNSDYVKGRKLIEQRVPVARSDRDMKDARHQGKSGHDVFEMFLQMKSVHVMRAVEPSLKVRYQTKSCSGLTDDNTKNHCLASQSLGLASRSQLASLLLDYNKYQAEQSAGRDKPL